MSIYVFKCGCQSGESGEVSIELKVCGPLESDRKRKRNQDGNFFEIWQNTYGSPPRLCTHYQRPAKDSTQEDLMCVEAEPVIGNLASSDTGSAIKRLEKTRHHGQISSINLPKIPALPTRDHNLVSAPKLRQKKNPTRKNASFTSFVGNAIFPAGETPNQKNLHRVLTGSPKFSTIICPSGYKFALKYTDPSRRSYVFKCGCQSGECGEVSIELKVCGPLESNRKRKQDGDLFGIWQNTYGSPPRMCCHLPKLGKAWTPDGALSMEAKAFMHDNFTPDMNFADMRHKLDQFFGHTVSDGPPGYSLSARNYFRALKRKYRSVYPEKLLKKGNLNQIMQFLLKKDFFNVTNIPRLDHVESNDAQPGPIKVDRDASIKDMLRALSVDENDFKHYYTITVSEADIPEDTSEHDMALALAMILIITPSLLFNLWEFLTKIERERQVIQADDTHNVLVTDHVFYVWGTSISDIHHGVHNGLITRQFRPFLYQLTQINTKLCGLLALKNIKRVAASAFGKSFVPRFVVIDYSMALWAASEAELPGVTMIRCYTHIYALFAKPDWVKKHFSKVENMGEVRRQIVLLHRCTTGAQFATLAEMCCLHWRINLEEEKFASYFEKYLGPCSRCKGMWWIGCMGYVGATPDNNCLENYWRGLKAYAASGGKNIFRQGAVIRLGRFLSEFFEFELPSMVKYDTVNRLSCRNYRNALVAPYFYMKTLWLAQAAMVTRKDVHVVFDDEMGTIKCLVPSPHHLRHRLPATAEDLEKYNLAKRGLEHDRVLHRDSRGFNCGNN